VAATSVAANKTLNIVWNTALKRYQNVNTGRIVSSAVGKAAVEAQKEAARDAAFNAAENILVQQQLADMAAQKAQEEAQRTAQQMATDAAAKAARESAFDRGEAILQAQQLRDMGITKATWQENAANVANMAALRAQAAKNATAMEQGAAKTGLFAKALAGLKNAAPGATAAISKAVTAIGGASTLAALGAAAGGITLVAYALVKAEEAAFKRKLGTGEEQAAQLSLYDEEMAAADLARAQGVKDQIEGMRIRVQDTPVSARQLEKAGETYKGEKDLERGKDALKAQAAKDLYAANFWIRNFGQNLNAGMLTEYQESINNFVDTAEVETTHDLHRLERVIRKQARKQIWSDFFQGAQVDVIKAINDFWKVVLAALLKAVDLKDFALDLSVKLYNTVAEAINKAQAELGVVLFKIPLKVVIEEETGKEYGPQGPGTAYMREAERIAKQNALGGFDYSAENMQNTFLGISDEKTWSNEHVDYFGAALDRINDKVDAAQKNVDGFNAGLSRLDDALFAVNQQSRALDLALRPYEDSLRRVEAAAALITIPLERQKRALEKNLKDTEDNAAKLRKQYEEENKQAQKAIEDAEAQLKLAKEKLDVISWNLFIEQAKNKINFRETSAQELTLKTQKLIQEDIVAAQEEALQKMRDELEARKEQQDKQIEAAEKQVEAANKQIEAIDAMLAAEQERVQYAQEEVELQKAYQVEQRITLEHQEDYLSNQREIMQRQQTSAQEELTAIQKVQDKVQELTDEYRKNADEMEQTSLAASEEVEQMGKDATSGISKMVTGMNSAIDKETAESLAERVGLYNDFVNIFYPRTVKKIVDLPMEQTIAGAAFTAQIEEAQKTLGDSAYAWLTDPSTGLAYIVQDGFRVLVENINKELENVVWPGVPDDIREVLKGSGILNNATKAATGFEGLIKKPRLFLAGEAGPEYVNIQPMYGSGVNTGQGMAMMGGGNSTSNVTTITNVNNFNVTGMYGQSQTPRSIRGDLQVAAAMQH
jgi:hypothetical protein